MRVLILGATGMLGHKLMQVLSRRFEVVGTVRGTPSDFADHPILHSARLLGGVQAEDFPSIVRALAAARPNVVVNCIGIIKQAPAARDATISITVNALFPHLLARLCQAAGSRLVHVSSDCVFSGRKGNYVETDPADPEDLYGRTKLLGEVDYEGCLTLRTSMIGRELASAYGLIEWFMGEEGHTVRGYARAIFTGLTTLALAETIAQVIDGHGELRGTWHVAAEPISKLDLISLVRQSFGLNVTIEPDETVVCDRSLDASRFRAATGIRPPSWDEMIAGMRDDPTPYAQIRSAHASR